MESNLKDIIDSICFEDHSLLFSGETCGSCNKVMPEDHKHFTQRMPERKSLLFSRTMWEAEAIHQGVYAFTKEELDNAQPNGFIGHKNGIDCYLQKEMD